MQGGWGHAIRATGLDRPFQMGESIEMFKWIGHFVILWSCLFLWRQENGARYMLEDMLSGCCMIDSHQGKASDGWGFLVTCT